MSDYKPTLYDTVEMRVERQWYAGRIEFIDLAAPADRRYGIRFPGGQMLFCGADSLRLHRHDECTR